VDLLQEQEEVTALPPKRVEAHEILLSFVGTMRHGLRYRVIDAAVHHPFLEDKWFESVNVVASDAPTADGGGSKAPSSAPPWAMRMAKSLLQLAPRGTNPSSFRLYEALQLGLIPVYVYDGERPWLPYHDPSLPYNGSSGGLWSSLGFVLPEASYTAFLDALPAIGRDQAWYNAVRRNIRAARDRYFTFEAVVRHLYAFFRLEDAEDRDDDGTSSTSTTTRSRRSPLRCNAPAHITAEGM
jgi:hypothetical protein